MEQIDKIVLDKLQLWGCGIRDVEKCQKPLHYYHEKLLRFIKSVDYTHKKPCIFIICNIDQEGRGQHIGVLYIPHYIWKIIYSYYPKTLNEKAEEYVCNIISLHKSIKHLHVKNINIYHIRKHDFHEFQICYPLTGHHTSELLIERQNLKCGVVETLYSSYTEKKIMGPIGRLTWTAYVFKNFKLSTHYYTSIKCSNTPEYIIVSIINSEKIISVKLCVKCVNYLFACKIQSFHHYDRCTIPIPETQIGMLDYLF